MVSQSCFMCHTTRLNNPKGYYTYMLILYISKRHIPVGASAVVVVLFIQGSVVHLSPPLYWFHSRTSYPTSIHCILHKISFEYCNHEHTASSFSADSRALLLTCGCHSPETRSNVRMCNENGVLIILVYGCQRNGPHFLSFVFEAARVTC
jgi:hypothetical protein